MDILVVGNGFDLAHGLPTKYWDFMELVSVFKYLKRNTREKVERNPVFCKLNENIKEYLLSDEVFNTLNHTEVLKEFDNLINNNIFIESFEDRYDLQNKGWIDFEFEISEIIKSLDYLLEFNKERRKIGSNAKVEDRLKYKMACEFLDKMKNKNVKNDDDVFSEIDFYGEDAKSIIDEMYNELNNLIRALEIYLGEFVEKVKVEKRLSDIESIPKIDKVISFNYTNTYEKIYDNNRKCDYDYVHGNIDINRDKVDNNMVLGIDEYLKEDKDKSIEFIKFKKYFQRLYKETKCLYRVWLEKQRIYCIDENNCEIMLTNAKNELEYCNNLYIYGHSLDITDKDILKELMEFPSTKTTIFYYDRDDYASKIANMVRIVGQDTLKKNCYGEYPKIIFKPIEN